MAGRCSICIEKGFGGEWGRTGTGKSGGRGHKGMVAESKSVGPVSLETSRTPQAQACLS
jgi:ribosomal protein L15